MSSYRTIVIFLLFILFSSNLATSAENEGSGTRGGGEVIIMDGQPRLSDVVGNTCRWREFGPFFEEQRETQELLTSLAETHWYFASAIRREAQTLKLCETGRLKRIPQYDRSTLLVTRHDGVPVALRVDDRVYLNVGLYRQMPRLDRGLLPIHEVNHSFLPMDITERKQKLESLNCAILDNHNERLTSEIFALAMTENEVDFMPDTKDIDSKRNFIEQALDDSAPLWRRFTGLSGIGMDGLAQLWFRHQEDISFFADNTFTRARYAVEHGRIHILDETLAVKVPVTLDWFGGLSLLDIASQVGSSTMITKLLQAAQGFDRSLSALDIIAARTLWGETSDIDLAMLLNLGANPNARVQAIQNQPDAPVITLVELAVRLGNQDALSLLANHDGVTPETIQEALESCILDWKEFAGAARILIATQKADLNRSAELAVASRQPEALQEILPTIDPNQVRSNGSTLLIQAAQIQNDFGSGLVAVLVSDSRTDLNHLDPQGLSAFDAAYKSRSGISSALIAADPRFTLPAFEGEDDQAKSPCRRVKLEPTHLLNK